MNMIKPIKHIRPTMQSAILLVTLAGAIAHVIHDHDIFRPPSSRLRTNTSPGQNERPGENERYGSAERKVSRRMQPKEAILMRA